MYNTIYRKIFEEQWPSVLGGVMLALLNIVMFWYSGTRGGITAVTAEWAWNLYRGAFLNVLTLGLL